jgi:hypothetical protein
MDDCSDDFKRFLRQSIARMSAARLRSSLARSGVGGSLYERAYQMEWYRAAVSYLPSKVMVAPDVGQVHKYLSFPYFLHTLSSFLYKTV